MCSSRQNLHPKASTSNSKDFFYNMRTDVIAVKLSLECPRLRFATFLVTTSESVMQFWLA